MYMQQHTLSSEFVTDERDVYFLHQSKGEKMAQESSAINAMHPECT